MAVRPATARDAAAVAGIYAHHVLHGTGTFEEVPPGADEMAGRMAQVLDHRWPWLVAEEDGTVLGYAYAAQLNPRSGYRYSCQDSIYVRADEQRRGTGSALLARLLADAAAAGFVRMFAIVGDSANAASIALHARYGFAQSGIMRAAGYKFGKWLDVVHMQRTIGKMR